MMENFNALKQISKSINLNDRAVYNHRSAIYCYFYNCNELISAVYPPSMKRNNNSFIANQVYWSVLIGTEVLFLEDQEIWKSHDTKPMGSSSIAGIKYKCK